MFVHIHIIMYTLLNMVYCLHVCSYISILLISPVGVLDHEHPLFVCIPADPPCIDTG